MGVGKESTETPLEIVLQVRFQDPYLPEVSEDAENAREFRLHNDGSWEFLDKNQQPILQGFKGVVLKPEAAASEVKIQFKLCESGLNECEFNPAEATRKCTQCGKWLCDQCGSLAHYHTLAHQPE